ncbi:MAG TPA: metallopeptidase family protein [Solirubrobacterales bacterium]|jgi:predicted Zn-dependent protease with MMP-like domain|nr:metallopeptidase family protein [Solirubrobacterales bacterium]
MSERLAPSARVVVMVAFLIGLGILIFDPFSFGRISGFMTLVAGALALVLIAALAAVWFSRGQMSEEEFRRIAERSELMSRLPAGQMQPSEFEELVIEAIDALPAEVQEVLRDVPIVISDLGHEFGAYGHYIGDTMARDNYRDHIVIYQDTLERDFAWDPDLLRAQITRTVFHEVAHHLGWGEQGVRDLGL